MTRAVLFLVAVMSVAPLCPRVSAMEFQMYDDMAVQDQQDYLKFLVDGAKKILTAQRRRDMATKVDQLFKAKGGAERSLGETKFAQNLASSREFMIQNPRGPLHFNVEGALAQTLATNGIDLPRTFQKDLAELAKNFFPQHPLRTSSLTP